MNKLNLKAILHTLLFNCLLIVLTSCDAGGEMESSDPNEPNPNNSVTSQLTFSPATLPGGSRIEPIWNEDEFIVESDFMSSYSSSVDHSSTSFKASNGTDYLSFLAYSGNPVTINVASGEIFSAISVDLAEYSQVFQEPKSITFVGVKADGSQVDVTFITDGVITGQGSDVDFEEFIFPTSFNSLIRIDILDGLFSMDNLVLTL
jgi:hypothetical protein